MTIEIMRFAVPFSVELARNSRYAAWMVSPDELKNVVENGFTVTLRTQSESIDFIQDFETKENMTYFHIPMQRSIVVLDLEASRMTSFPVERIRSEHALVTRIFDPEEGVIVQQDKMLEFGLAAFLDEDVNHQFAGSYEISLDSCSKPQLTTTYELWNLRKNQIHEWASRNPEIVPDRLEKKLWWNDLKRIPKFKGSVQ